MNKIRSNIKEVLELIASKGKQIDYVKRVPMADIPSELVCMWFDDSYHPNSREHKEAFSTAEQEILLKFNEFYDMRVSGLPKTFAKLKKDPQWDEIVHAAQKVLIQINW